MNTKIAYNERNVFDMPSKTFAAKYVNFGACDIYLNMKIKCVI